MTSEKNRIEWIDLAKGVCIILLVMQHSGISFPVSNYLRMPFYFFVSGLFFKDYGCLLNLCIKKTNKLIIPFLFFYTLYEVSLYFVDYLIENGEAEFNPYFFRAMSDCFFGNGVLWFLLCLFWCNIIYYLINKVENVYEQIVYILVLAKIGAILWNSNFFLPFHLSTSFLALPFFFLGSFTRNRLPSVLRPNRFDKYNIPTAIGGIFLIMLLSNYVANGHVSFYDNRLIGNYYIYYPYAIVMVGSILLLCKTFKRIPLVSYCGRYSIIILGTHVLYISLIKRLLPSIAIHNWALFTISLLLSIISIIILKNLCPHLTAQKETIPIFNPNQIANIRQYLFGILDIRKHNK